jgi:hypothetical protein
MTSKEEWTTEDRLQALAETRQLLEAVERERQHLWNQSRAISMELITEDRLSVAKVAMLSGHHRNTLGVWLDVWNAEHKSAGKKK